MSPVHHCPDATVFRGTIVFRTAKLGRAYFRDSSGRQVTFDRQPTVQLTLTDSTLAPAWKSRFLKDAQGQFIGMDVSFGATQAGQTVEWVASAS